jgi:phytoene/squalene synthetase
LAEAITREASTQTYYTICCLVDRPLVADAYRAYAYFRWVDDIVDQTVVSPTDPMNFLARQQAIVNSCYQGELPEKLCPEEQMVAELIRGDRGDNGSLHMYITQMMAVMLFDAGRKGRLITQADLAGYTHSLAMAVTEAMHYFIGHDAAAPYDETRYLAVTGAHITHMLRDAVEDAAAGYTNIPQEVLEQHQLTPTDWSHEAYRAWVQQRVQLARHCFAVGRHYLARLKSLRCRLAGYAYITRFEVVLDLIEKDAYCLRLAYPERKSKRAALKMCLTTLMQTGLSLGPGRHTPLTYPISSTEVLR